MVNWVLSVEAQLDLAHHAASQGGAAREVFDPTIFSTRSLKGAKNHG
jgi:hypothetical protein